MEIEILKPPSETFRLDEAFKMMHCTVIPKDMNSETPSIDDTGVIQGVLDTENEIELVIRFMDGLKRYDKEGFKKDFKIYEQK
ncbi:MAG: hypothetical protein V7785_18050 [Bermanella sp.]